MTDQTELERAVGEVPADTFTAYMDACRQRGRAPTPAGLLDYAGVSIDGPSPEARAAAVAVIRASVERRHGVRIVPTTDPSSPHRIVVPLAPGRGEALDDRRELRARDGRGDDNAQ